jgi:hypothetical protein
MNEENQTVTVEEQEQEQEQEQSINEEEMISIPVKRFKERLERAKRQIVKQYGGVEPAAVEALQIRIGELEGERNEVFEREANLISQREMLEHEVQMQQSKHQDYLLQQELTTAFLQNGGLPSALSDAITSMQMDQKYAIDQQTGAVINKSEADDQTMDDYVKLFLAEKPYFVNASGKTGSGMMPGNSRRVTPDYSAAEQSLDSRQARLSAARTFVRN